MRYLLDTNAISDLMRNDARLSARLNLVLPPDAAIICPVVRGEVLFGIERLPVGKRQKELYDTAMRVLPGFRCEPITEPMAEIFSELKRACEKIGVAASDSDLWIAAVSRFHNAVVVTRDADLARIPGLHVEDWTR